MAPTTSLPIEPMRAVNGDAVPTDDENWSYEIKWDGMRAVARVGGGTISLHSVNGIDATERFPELAALGEALAAHRAVLDGEIVALDEHGKPSFGRLQPRMQARSASAVRQSSAQPIVYVLFDLLELDGHDLTGMAYEQRRQLLLALVEPGACWRVTEAWTGGGADLLAAMADQGLEGLIAKQLGSRYKPGRRSNAWRKLKVRRRQELVVGGWLGGEGSRAATFGSLLVGHHDPTSTRRLDLRYAGRVGTGFVAAELVRLRDALDDLHQDECPFAGPLPAEVSRLGHWVRPEVVVEVAFHEWTADGVLRQPSFVGQRVDKDPAEVVREPG